MNHTYTEIRKTLLSLAKPERANVLARFFKTAPGQYGEGDQFLGLTMPEQRIVVKQYQDTPLNEIEKLVQDPLHECRMVGLLIWVRQYQKARPSQKAVILDYYVRNRRYINNWDLVDVTCPHIVGHYVATNPDRSILYELVEEESLWSKRIAIISTLALIRLKQFDDTFNLSETLLSHKHDLIHKAVGWMLREVGKRNADALEEFLHDHIRQMPRTALRYAIERFPPNRRRYYLEL